MKLDKNIKNLQEYMANQLWLVEGEQIHEVEVPGEGNMNFTLRLKTNQRSVIIKQSRAYVEKYPQVAAPQKRALMEAAFYQEISKNQKLKAQMPSLIAVDEENSILLMEDLGAGADYTSIYKNGVEMDEAELLKLMDFAAELHNNFTVEQTQEPIRNREMRKLNHEHMFVYPYIDENGLNLDDVLPGLAAVAKKFKEDKKLQERLKNIGELYLADGKHLLHGDFFPGSWLLTNDGVKVIDPEFCFYGSAEFEIGVTVAHLKMADQSEELISKAVQHYQSKAKLDIELMEAHAAAEIMRRILGLAQLPLEINLSTRESLLEQASQTLSNFN